jgi:hypothetical protein
MEKQSVGLKGVGERIFILSLYLSSFSAFTVWEKENEKDKE